MRPLRQPDSLFSEHPPAMAMDPPIPCATDALFAVLPSLQGYARALTRNHHDSEDLIQDSIVRILAAADRFQPGTNFRAWAFTIVRNRFLTAYVTSKRRLVCMDDVDLEIASTAPTQMQGLELRDLQRQFELLPITAQFVLRQASEESVPYAAMAKAADCAVNTIKSRVHRARAAMRKQMQSAYH
ncbi:sigma-70 family RNA polymerase sigma factor [Neoroseomonas lacus]|uniref:sigma-70 family RNA polymerase sigma factor n=1 Tax=Neoroseomonas lacus TaxID=287609 RepID=UPI001666FB89|nr:sigma-70 family RNA polymerase sigma factor [Neoroseomonas lacus]